ncbi:MAG TPA: BMC domain-containing protein [candidate division Zixibacteria bacterium]|nr:BMC domain-containing protein [candidate division Zixibacteria bacterium]
MEYNAIGLIEYSSIAKGIGSADAMVKAAAVDLVISRTICSGKYMNLVAGDVQAVKSAVADGELFAREAVIGTFIIPNVHPDVFLAMSGSTGVEKLDALGIVESFSVAALIEGADAAAKAAEVKLIEVRLAMALGGKAFFTMTGAVGAVRSAVTAAEEVISREGMLVNTVVIPSPRPELLRDIL